MSCRRRWIVELILLISCSRPLGSASGCWCIQYWWVEHLHFCSYITKFSTIVQTLTYQIIYFTEDSECSNPLQLTVEIMFPLYSLFILFFIFKYCNIVINSYRGLARLMLMHAIGTSLAFWVYTIVRETQDAINMKNYYYRKEIKSLWMSIACDSNIIFICPQTRRNSWRALEWQKLKNPTIFSPMNVPGMKIWI